MGRLWRRGGVLWAQTESNQRQRIQFPRCVQALVLLKTAQGVGGIRIPNAAGILFQIPALHQSGLNFLIALGRRGQLAGAPGGSRNGAGLLAAPGCAFGLFRGLGGPGRGFPVTGGRGFSGGGSGLMVRGRLSRCSRLGAGSGFRLWLFRRSGICRPPGQSARNRENGHSSQNQTSYFKKKGRPEGLPLTSKPLTGRRKAECRWDTGKPIPGSPRRA